MLMRPRVAGVDAYEASRGGSALFGGSCVSKEGCGGWGGFLVGGCCGGEKPPHNGTISAHSPCGGVVLYEHMFGTAEGTSDQATRPRPRALTRRTLRLLPPAPRPPQTLIPLPIPR